MFAVVNLCSVRIHRCTVISYESSSPTPISGPKAKYLELTRFDCNKRRYRDENQKHVNLHGRFNHFSFSFIQLIIVSLFAILISLIHFQAHLLHNHDCSGSFNITFKKNWIEYLLRTTVEINFQIEYDRNDWQFSPQRD
jgi:hypothetical protein